MRLKNKILGSLMLLIVVLTTVAVPTLAQNTTGQRIAAVHDGQLVIIEDFTTATPQIIPVMEVIFGQISPVWSSDGQWLAFKNFVSQADGYNPLETIYVTDGGSEPIALVTAEIISGMPISWSQDNSQIIYAAYDGPVESRNFTEDGATVALLYGIAPEANAQPVQIGSFAIREGCGGGSPYPADWLYSQETELRGTRAILQLTPSGLVHTAACAGNLTSVTNLETGETTLIGRENVQHAVVSPDGTQVAGTEDGQIVIYDLPTGSIEYVQPAAEPDQLAWGFDGALYYSSRIENRDLMTGLDAGQQAVVTQFTGATTIPAYEASIYRLGSDEPIFSGDYYAVGRMALLPDNSGMVFSITENMDAWVNGIADGTFDFSDEDDFDEQQNSVATNLVYLPFDGEPIIHRDFRQFALNNGI